MHIGQSIEIFMLVKHLVGVVRVVAIGVVHQDDLLLALFILLSQLLVFAAFIFNGLNELTLHRRL